MTATRSATSRRMRSTRCCRASRRPAAPGHRYLDVGGAVEGAARRSRRPSRAPDGRRHAHQHRHVLLRPRPAAVRPVHGGHRGAGVIVRALARRRRGGRGRLGGRGGVVPRGRLPGGRAGRSPTRSPSPGSRPAGRSTSSGSGGTRSPWAGVPGSGAVEVSGGASYDAVRRGTARPGRGSRRCRCPRRRRGTPPPSTCPGTGRPTSPLAGPPTISTPEATLAARHLTEVGAEVGLWWNHRGELCTSTAGPLLVELADGWVKPDPRAARRTQPGLRSGRRIHGAQPTPDHPPPSSARPAPSWPSTRSEPPPRCPRLERDLVTFSAFSAGVVAALTARSPAYGVRSPTRRSHRDTPRKPPRM